MRPIRQTVLVCTAGIAFSAVLLGPAQLTNTVRGGNDFAAFYTSGKVAFSHDLYDVRAFMEKEELVTGWSGRGLVFIRLPWQAVFFTPLAAFSYPTAHAIWLLLCAVSVVVFVRCWPSVPAIVRAGAVAWSIPVAVALAAGQDVPLLLVALSGCFLLIEREKPVAAGLCLSLCAAKPHIFWPLGLVFLFRRQWSVCAGGLLGAGCLLAVSFLSAGTGWVRGFTEALAYLTQIDGQDKLALMPTLPALLTGLSGAALIETGAVVATIAAALMIRNGKTAAAVAILMGIVTARHAFLADCSFALVSLFLVWDRGWRRWLLLAAASPLGTLPAFFGHASWTAVALLGGAICLTVEMAPGLLPGVPPRSLDAQS